MQSKKAAPRPAGPDARPQICAPVLVLAGGKGSRLRNTSDPELSTQTKLLTEIDRDGNRLPMIISTLGCLAVENPEGIVLMTSRDPGAQGCDIQRAVTEWHDRDHPPLDIVAESVPLGTAGAVYNATVESNLIDDKCHTVIVTPADTIFPYSSLRKVLSHHLQHHASATWVTTSVVDSTSQNPGRIIVDRHSYAIHDSLEGKDSVFDGFVVDENDSSRMTSAGVLALNLSRFTNSYQSIIDRTGQTVVDIYRELLPTMIAEGGVIYYDVQEPVHDLGTPERFYAHGRSTSNPQRPHSTQNSSKTTHSRDDRRIRGSF